jgi:hypothetical protein
MGYSRDWGKLIYEKKSKISRHCPFKEIQRIVFEEAYAFLLQYKFAQNGFAHLPKLSISFSFICGTERACLSLLT